MKVDYWNLRGLWMLYEDWLKTPEAAAVKVQIKAAYFDHLEFPPIEPPPTIEELGKKYLDAHRDLLSFEPFDYTERS